jgi:hypothetical protein
MQLHRQHPNRAAACILLQLPRRRWYFPAARLHHLPAHDHSLTIEVRDELHTRLPVHHGRLLHVAWVAAAAAAHVLQGAAAVQRRCAFWKIYVLCNALQNMHAYETRHNKQTQLLHSPCSRYRHTAHAHAHDITHAHDQNLPFSP